MLGPSEGFFLGTLVDGEFNPIQIPFPQPPAETFIWQWLVATKPPTLLSPVYVKPIICVFN